MKINITADNIEHGVRSCDETCALALAFKDAGFTGVSVGDKSVDLWDAESDDAVFPLTKSYWLLKELVSFIEQFDDECEVEPMSFELNDLRPVIYGKELTT